MTKRILKGGVVLFCFLFFATGCATSGYREREGFSSPDIEKSLTVASTLRFDDIPTPLGFVQIPNESFVFQSEALRAGVLKYYGKSTPDSVVQFYKEQMPIYNWQLVNLVEYGRKQLNFEKPGQSCIVAIEGTRSKAIVTISVGPKSEKAKVQK